MAKLSKTFVAHVSMPKKTSQSGKKRSCKMSSMNKSKKRSLKFYSFSVDSGRQSVESDSLSTATLVQQQQH